MMEARVPDLPKGSDIRPFGEVATQIDLASEQHIQKLRNRSTTSPQVIDRRRTADRAKKANTCRRIEEHKQEQGRMQHNCRCMIKLTSWGLTNRSDGETVLID
jgi:hypothetical protein